MVFAIILIIAMFIIVPLCLIGLIFWFVVKNKDLMIYENNSSGIINESKEYDAGQFFQMRRMSFKNGAYSRLVGNRDFAGVYIIHNKTKNKYYVGQGKRVLERSSKHFYGYGNGDVYADFKYGDKFTIRFIPLNGSGFSNLDDLERYAISKYNAYYNGYNRTRGNH